MELHEKLSLAIAASDLRYVAGSILGAENHPRTWPFAQWGAMVAYETAKTLSDVHACRLELGWELEIATAARHGGKFFDVRRASQLDDVVADFHALGIATHAAFYPDDRRGRLFDFLRDDFAVLADGPELVLTNVTGHFMVGLPPDRVVQVDSWGPHVHDLAMGIGQLTTALVGEGRYELRTHGNKDSESLTWWDGKIAKVVPAIFGGQLEPDLAMAVVSILSTVQASRLWAHAECCGSCDAASLKHRFVVLHHAARSLQQLAARPEILQPLASKHVHALTDSADLRTIVDAPFRRLRNGWLHLGLGDIAATLPTEVNILTPVQAYTQMDLLPFTELVDRGLDQIATGIGAWLAEPGDKGLRLFDCLHRPPG
ncbi:hypothetical protein F8O07_07310 [Pseudoclavibacter sp. CFCC 13796]|uniref:hypothetical protein n=1 Tax=Pseudoclavibacter sp. CFCC 13796 TaxID=2615179 RepID=UPI001301024C|nr:hypothetical protein [Pseudoclavibacter sp. CFCC 13796]KAB1661697.1 hypothetical protein F8O07_07310 [Pseudoclavibacter sp. CFCC 13796]